NQQYNYLARDIEADEVYRVLSRPSVFLVVCLFHVIGLVGPSIWIFGPAGLVVAWISSVIAYNLGDSIDSLGHLCGKRTLSNHSLATDSFWMAILTFGEGWHSTHHRFPSSARHGIGRGQFDWTYWQLK